MKRGIIICLLLGFLIGAIGAVDLPDACLGGNSMQPQSGGLAQSNQPCEYQYGSSRLQFTCASGYCFFPYGCCPDPTQYGFPPDNHCCQSGSAPQPLIQNCNSLNPGYSFGLCSDTIPIPNGCDYDEDNYNAIYSNDRPACSGNDCNDYNPLIHPGATEICTDSIDNDCDGLIDCTDPDCLQTFYRDADNDLYGNLTVTTQAQGCLPPAGYTNNSNDCNDSNVNIHPGATEICENGIDENCDGADALCGGWVCVDADHDGYNVTGGACGLRDCNDSNVNIHPGATEICGNGIDENCDGTDLLCRDCILISASWLGTRNVSVGNSVQLNIVGSNCNGERIDFEVREHDAFFSDPVTINPNSTIYGIVNPIIWIAEWQEDGVNGINNPPEYYFRAIVASNGRWVESGKNASQLLTVNQYIHQFNDCSIINSCADYTPFGQTDCERDNCSRGNDNMPPVQCNVRNCSGTNGFWYSDCRCVWSENVCKEANTRRSCGGDEDLYTGTCEYTESLFDNCDDGYLEYSWNSSWVWDVNNNYSSNPGGNEFVNDSNGYWHYDPFTDEGIRLSGTCVSGSNTISCPAQVKLSFFSFYNIILVVVIIFIIYYFMIKSKTKKKIHRKK